MKDVEGKITYQDKEYRIVFNFNVMAALQEEYGSVEAWGKLTDGAEGEPNAKAIIFGFTEMLNEGIDIENEENGSDLPKFTRKKVGRILYDIGLGNATKVLNDTVVESTKGEEKNA